MIIFGVAQGKNPEADRMCLELVYTHLNINKKLVGVFYRDGDKLVSLPSIMIKEVEKGLEIAKQHNQRFVLVKKPGIGWEVINPSTRKIVMEVRLRPVTWECIQEKKPFLYVKYGDKVYAAEALTSDTY